MSNLKEYLNVTKDHIEIFFKKLLPAYDNKTSMAMHYAVMNGGKRIRPTLTYLIGELLNAPKQNLHAAASAVELIHCYSLVHDDLPAMDDDDLRRGKPSCHKKFDEATAILAGDALQTLAFEALSNNKMNPVSDKLKIKMIDALSRASGSRGMVLGQTLDLASENKKINLEELIELHLNKTGKLIAASVELGIFAADYNNAELIKNLIEYAKSIGLLFQIQDDILDVTSSTETLGKPANSDLKQKKSTFVSLMGLKNAKSMAQDILQSALDYVDLMNKYNDIDKSKLEMLKNIAEYFYYREY